MNKAISYTIESSLLADWLNKESDTWWCVDGDDELTAHLDFPCPAEELSAYLNKTNRAITIYNPRNVDFNIDSDDIVGLADTNNNHKYRTFLVSFDGRTKSLLVEDRALE